jgi:DNA primase catalytic subunit
LGCDTLHFCLPPTTQVLQELVGDKSLERFRQEYEKLHRALKKSNEGEKRLFKKCRDLNSEIVSNAVKVQTALRLSQEDQDTIASLKRVRAAGIRMLRPAQPALVVATPP